MIEYRLIRAKRKTISLKVERDGTLSVRAPIRMKGEEIDSFVRSKIKWINKCQKEVLDKKKKADALAPIGEKDVEMLKASAKKYLPQRVAYYAKIVGVEYGNITVRCQKSRWGSCTSKGNLNFNCLLMLLPEAVSDYVIVHELCHRRHMDHSPAFWCEVKRYMPDYEKHRAYLRSEGSVLLSRVR